MEVSSISALPRHAVSEDSWCTSCTLRLERKAKTKPKKEENILKSKCLKKMMKSWYCELFSP